MNKRRNYKKKPTQKKIKSHKKFYAVAVGRDGPDVYSTWPECKSKVNGFPGALFKGFDSHEEAIAYIDKIVNTRNRYLDDYNQRHSEPMEDDDIDAQLDAVLQRHE